MKDHRLVIIHFNPVELYPPLQNLLNYVSKDVKDIEVTVVTNRERDCSLYRVKGENSVSVKRSFSLISKSSLARVFNYCSFYLISFFWLLSKRPAKVLYYESLSFIPVYYYYKLLRIFGKSCQIFCHYHEYTSKSEYQSGTFLNKLNYALERKLYSKMSWISHTNKERGELFLLENPEVSRGQLNELPNYPPGDWRSEATYVSDDEVLRVVYVGAIGLKSMYFKEFCQWVESFDGKVSWDVYSTQSGENLLAYLKSIKATNIYFKGAVAYEELPKVLHKYSLGIILYKGLTLNYVYNAPNKLFEYLTLGLNVFYPEQMVGCNSLKSESNYPLVVPIDFLNMSTIKPDKFKRKVKEDPKFPSAENIYYAFISKIKG